MSTLRANTILAVSGLTADPVAIPGLDKRFATSWVNFNGSGVVAIRSQYNVASITDNGVGDYTVNFAVPLADTNYAVFDGPDSDARGDCQIPGGTLNTTGYRVIFNNSTPAPADQTLAFLMTFGGQA